MPSVFKCDLYGRPSVGAPSPDDSKSKERGAPTEGRPYRFIHLFVLNLREP